MKFARRVGGSFLADEILAGSDQIWEAVADDGRLAAVAGASVPDETLHLTLCIVAPWARGNGLQRRLIDVRLRWGRRNGATRAHTYCATDNRPSLISLVRKGFSPFRADHNFVQLERSISGKAA